MWNLSLCSIVTDWLLLPLNNYCRCFYIFPSPSLHVLFRVHPGQGLLGSLDLFLIKCWPFPLTVFGIFLQVFWYACETSVSFISTQVSQPFCFSLLFRLVVADLLILVLPSAPPSRSSPREGLTVLSVSSSCDSCGVCVSFTLL